MALVNCPSCGQQISSFADACPHCGHRSGNISDRRYYAAIAATAPVEFALASAIAGTACFALSLYLQVSHLTLDAFLVLPYHLRCLFVRRDPAGGIRDVLPGRRRRDAGLLAAVDASSFATHLPLRLDLRHFLPKGGALTWR